MQHALTHTHSTDEHITSSVTGSGGITWNHFKSLAFVGVTAVSRNEESLQHSIHWKIEIPASKTRTITSLLRPSQKRGLCVLVCSEEPGSHGFSERLSHLHVQVSYESVGRGACGTGVLLPWLLVNLKP